MTAENFCFWFMGLLEGNPQLKSLDEEQLKIVRAHLNLAFIHDIDPKAGGEGVQLLLNAAHDQGKKHPFGPSANIRC